MTPTRAAELRRLAEEAPHRAHLTGLSERPVGWDIVDLARALTEALDAIDRLSAFRKDAMDILTTEWAKR